MMMTTTTIEPGSLSGRIVAMWALPCAFMMACGSPPEEVAWPEPPPPTMAQPIGVQEAPKEAPAAPESAQDVEAQRGASEADSAAPVLPPDGAPSSKRSEAASDSVVEETAPL